MARSRSSRRRREQSRPVFVKLPQRVIRAPRPVPIRPTIPAPKKPMPRRAKPPERPRPATARQRKHLHKFGVVGLAAGRPERAHRAQVYPMQGLTPCLVSARAEGRQKFYAMMRRTGGAGVRRYTQERRLQRVKELC